MGCISYVCVFNVFPFDSNALRMKPKAYHYQDLFFATVIWEKLDILKMNGFTYEFFFKMGSTQTSEAKWFSIVYQFKRLLISYIRRKKKIGITVWFMFLSPNNKLFKIDMQYLDILLIISILH